MRSIAIICGVVYGCLPQLASAHAAIINNEAWAACKSLAKSDTCEFTNNHDVYRGTCQLMPDELMCVRNQPIVYANPEAAKP